ncbi:MAG: hypothetical protein EBU46_18680 [Nitrosomonadaceae bacterium]|nr:hypothetical protein [Nitrosomonadaceae bacterium]
MQEKIGAVSLALSTQTLVISILLIVKSRSQQCDTVTFTCWNKQFSLFQPAALRYAMYGHQYGGINLIGCGYVDKIFRNRTCFQNSA